MQPQQSAQEPSSPLPNAQVIVLHVLTMGKRTRVGFRTRVAASSATSLACNLAHCVGCVGFLVESTANYGPLVLWALASVASASSWSRPPTMGLLCYGPLASVASASSWSRPPTMGLVEPHGHVVFWPCDFGLYGFLGKM